MKIRELNETLAKLLKEDSKGLLKLSDNLVNRLTFEYLGSEDKLPCFNSLEDLEEYIKSTNSFPDNFFYQDALYTNDEYDMDGKYLSYGCPQLDKGIIVRTPDGRYNYKGNYAELEMEIEESDGWSYRFDLTYYLPKEVYLALYNKSESLNHKKSMKEAVGVSDIDDLAKDYFQPYMTYNEYKNGRYNAYMVWNTDLVYISEGGAKSEIIGASSKRELKGKIAAIRTYEYEKQYGRNEQGEPPTLANTKGLFKK